jgi:hypothetical protein
MRGARVWYRVRQFWQAATSEPGKADLAQLEPVLPPGLMALYLQQSPAEQVHSLRVYKDLLSQGETDPDLLAAALLHDVGKCLFPLRLWERSAIVLGDALAPKRAERWGEQPSGGWPPPGGSSLVLLLKKPFVVAYNHPEWGARLVEQAGGSPLTAALIRRHQKTPLPGSNHREDILLAKLRTFDNKN